jgi:coenzyme F420-reducing hydrogenase alpha subunit
MMRPEGEIIIDLFPGAKLKAINIASSRPLSITKQFARHRPEDITRTVSLLFATCKAAQTIAAAEAFEDALGLPPPANCKQVRAMLVLAESAREHALRILMDWPQFLHIREEPPAAILRSLVQLHHALSRALDENGSAAHFGGTCALRKDKVEGLVRELKSLLEKAIFAEDLSHWRACASVSDLKSWAEKRETPAQRLICRLANEDLLGIGASELPALPATEKAPLVERLFAHDHETYIARPTWEGCPRETSALSRNQSHPLVQALKTRNGYGVGARLVAGLIELSQIMDRILECLDQLTRDQEGKASHAPLAPGIGVAQVEAARGRLVHAVKMDGGKVGHYRILAPTEWNFHPSGSVARGLERIAKSGARDCAMHARLLVIAAGPCVGAEVRVR